MGNKSLTPKYWLSKDLQADERLQTPVCESLTPVSEAVAGSAKLSKSGAVRPGPDYLVQKTKALFERTELS